MKKKIKKRDVLMVQGVEPAVRCGFKAACARRGRTMREVIVELLIAFTQKK